MSAEATQAPIVPNTSMLPPESAATPHTARLEAVILAVAAALRVPGYGRSVWMDELYAPDFFFGDEEFWLRVPPLLSGVRLAQVGSEVARDTDPIRVVRCGGDE